VVYPHLYELFYLFFRL